MVRHSREVWAEHVKALKASGQTAVAYAKEHEVSLKALYSWDRKLRLQSSGVAKPAVTKAASDDRFVALRVSPVMISRAPVPCALILNSGLRLEMAVLPDPSWLLALAQGAH
jgi:transposase-like protein